MQSVTVVPGPSENLKEVLLWLMVLNPITGNVTPLMAAVGWRMTVGIKFVVPYNCVLDSYL